MQGYEEYRLAGRLKWLMFFRLLFALCGITAVLAVESGFREPLARAHLPTYYTFIFACAVNVVYLVAVRTGAPPRRMAVVQLSVDLLIVSALVYLAGPDRLFTFLYFATVIAAALLISPRAGFVFATAATALLAGATVAYDLAARSGGRLPFVETAVWLEYAPRRPFLTAYLFFFALSLHAVAFLASLLAAEVSRIRVLNDEILHNMAGGVLAVDRYGGVAFVNAQAARLMELPAPEAALGRPYAEALPAPVAATVEHALRGGTRIEREISLGKRPVQVLVSYLTEGPGRLRAVVAILNDLTLRRDVERMAQREERFKALLEMSAGIAHEIRNPLASIRGAAQELESTPGANDDDRKLLQVIMRESDRLDKIISDFLEYASEKPLDLEDGDLARILEDTVVLLESREEAKHVEVTRAWTGPIPVRVDSDRLQQVFLNLGINSMEACAERGGRIVVRAEALTAPPVTTTGHPRSGVVVEFRDDGPGMAPEVVAGAFTPFFSTKARGTGMGLAIARKIVQAHGGDVTLESEAGRGTTARVWLPRT
ncbi:MAG: PAS domain-containing protein [Planctomycetes bacterium]|nr:PAS domain-containing protein [Planctomycetota bacterium]